MSEIILRLMRKVDDGVKTAGYMKFDRGMIYVSAHQDFHNCSPIMQKRINPQLGHCRWQALCFIPHDRKDQYTGIDIDGDKVFERDEVEAEKTWHCEGGGSDIHTQKWEAVIKYFPSRGEYRLCMKGASSTRNLYEMEIIKITGIQGVKDEG